MNPHEDPVKELAETAPSARYSAAVGPVPDVIDTTTWEPAWQRECGRAHWVRMSRAHVIFHGVDQRLSES